MLQGKRCSGCGEIKPLTEYHRNVRSKDGRAAYCKVCRRAYGRAYNAEHKAEKAAYSRAYNAEHKEERNADARNYYEMNKEEITTRQRDYYEEHREERSTQMRDWRETHKEELVIYASVYREVNKESIKTKKRAYNKTSQGRAAAKAAHARRRARMGEQYLTAATIQEVLDASNGICPYCGEPFTDGHVDHIMPVAKQGTNDRANLVYCCAHCNLSKGDKLLEDWLQERDDV